MKPRRVVLVVEVESDLPIAVLRDATQVRVFVQYEGLLPATHLRVLQLQANVIRSTTPRFVKDGAA